MKVRYGSRAMLLLIGVPPFHFMVNQGVGNQVRARTAYSFRLPQRGITYISRVLSWITR